MLSRQSLAPIQLPTGNTVGLGEGAILAGKYRIEKVIGSGGMGVVMAATHLQLERRVAIKFLFLEALENPEITARFMREARAAVRIQSEHVARVIDVATFDGGAPFIVMEYLEGSDLAQVLASRGPFSIELAVAYILQMGEALAEAHGLGIVHRDLKPSNLFITRRPDGSNAVKVLDFGISKVQSTKSSSPGETITRTGSLLGSPLYMSPEQMTTPREVDARTDIWALGAILYEMVTGRPPFSGETIPQLCASILDGKFPAMDATRSDVPPALEAVVARCLEKDRRRRFQSIAELAAALRDLAPSSIRSYADRITRISREHPNSSLSSLDRDAGAPAGPSAATSAQKQVPIGRRRTHRRAAAILLGVSLLIVIGLALVRNMRAPDPDGNRAVVLTDPLPRATVAPPSSETETLPKSTLASPSPAPHEPAPTPEKIAGSAPNVLKLANAQGPKGPAASSGSPARSAAPAAATTPTLAAAVEADTARPMATAAGALAPVASSRSPTDLFSDRK